MEEVYAIIRRFYDHNRQLFNLRRELLKLEKEYPRHIYDLRQAKISQEEYRNGSISAIFHKLSGKYDQKLEQFVRAVHNAQSSHDSCKRQLESCKSMIVSLESDAEDLLTREELFAKYPDNDYLKQHDALFCAQCLIPLLEENLNFLMCARDWAENRNAEFKLLGTQFDMSLALQNASGCASKVCQLLEQINSVGFVVEIHPYFENPNGFIAAVVRQYGQHDRINYAINAVRATTAAVLELTQMLDNDN